MKKLLILLLCFHSTSALFSQEIITLSELKDQWKTRTVNQYEGIYHFYADQADTLYLALLHDNGHFYQTIFISGNILSNRKPGEVLGTMTIRAPGAAALNLFRPLQIEQRSYRHIPCRFTGYSLEMMLNDKTMTLLRDQSGMSSMNIIESTPEYDIIDVLPTLSGLYEVRARLNDVIDINLLIDSGASNCQITPDLLLTLYRTGTLDVDDFIDDELFRLADGSLVEYERFLLREIKIGNMAIKGVETVLAYDLFAPLILGQNALARLGKIEFDFENHQLKIFK